MHPPIGLIISANPSQAALLHTCLRGVGYLVFEANRGERAPELLIQIHPQLLLLDWELPDLSALALVRAVRLQFGFSKLPIILFGSEISSENKVLCLEAGVDICLDGIIHPKEFQARVRALLRRLDRTYQVG